MVQFRIETLKKGPFRCLSTGVLAASLFLPVPPASAFFQQTKLEGPVGTDLGGVWLSVQNVMPEFRISYQRPTSGLVLPLKVGPIPPELRPLAGPKPEGMVIAECIEPAFCTEYGLLVGDIVVRVNATTIVDAASFDSAVPDGAKTILLSIRRPALKMTTARLLKIRYSAEPREVDGASVADEELDLRILDVQLPFAEAIEKSRRTHELYEPSPEEIEKLGKNWFELETSSPPVFISGKHRFVAKSDFDEALGSDAALANSSFALLADLEGNPLQGGGGKVIDVYGIEEVGAKKISGNYVTVTMASAPFPINIEFKGRFEMTRLADWSDQDDKLRAKKAASTEPPEDLGKYKTVPDVPSPAKEEGTKD